MILSTMEFAEKYPSAFQALPSAYQNDSCLEFDDRNYCEGSGVARFLIARPKADQEFALGSWEAQYVHRQWYKVIQSGDIVPIEE